MIDYVKLVENKISFIVRTPPGIGTVTDFKTLMAESDKPFIYVNAHIVEPIELFKMLMAAPDALFAIDVNGICATSDGVTIQAILKSAADKSEISYASDSFNAKFTFTGSFVLFVHTMDHVNNGLTNRCLIINVENPYMNG